MNLRISNIPTLVSALVIVFSYAGNIAAQRVPVVTQLADMQNQIDQLRSDVDYLLSQVRELRGEAGIVETTPAPVTEDTADYIYAHCRLLPNAGIDRDLYEPIVGDIDFKQKTTGGVLSMKLNLYGFQTPYSLHGMHVHTYGDLRRGCGSTGPHYKPRGNDHGAPTDQIRHIGDFGNIQADETGSIRTEMTDNVATLTGQYSVLGRTLLIHGGEDDLGRGGDAGSKRSGNAGVQLGCCVIGFTDGSAWEK